MTSGVIRTSALTVGYIVTIALPVPPAAGDSQPEMIRDKTLVAWVSLTNLSQRAGSALTLIDEHERFDAIVFGERAPGKEVFKVADGCKREPNTPWLHSTQPGPATSLF